MAETLIQATEVVTSGCRAPNYRGRWLFHPQHYRRNNALGDRLRAESGVGVSFALHSTAPGKAMLAALSKESFQSLRPRLKLTRYTSKTITNLDVLDDMLAKTRSSGIAYDLEENSEGICAMAMALQLPSGDLAAVSIPVPSQRFNETRSRLEKQLASSCRKLQQGLS